jgi:RNA recognition motif-containing protein
MDHFKKKYHSVVDAKIPQDNATRISRGYGFVHFTNYDESQKAINEMNGSLLKGKPIKVNHASSKTTNTQGSNSGGSNHLRGNTHPGNNQSVFGQIYGNGYVGSPTGGQRGGPILQGLGVQFKPTDQHGQPMMAMPPQQYAYINPNTGQPMQAQFAVGPGAASLYAHQLAAAGQQGLIYGYPQAALGKMPGSNQQDQFSNQMMTNDPATLHALSMSANGQLGAAGLYSAAHLGVLSRLIC